MHPEAKIVLSGGTSATARSHTLGRTEATPRYVSLVHGITPCTASVALLPVMTLRHNQLAHSKCYRQRVIAEKAKIPTVTLCHHQRVVAGKAKNKSNAIRRSDSDADATPKRKKKPRPRIPEAKNENPKWMRYDETQYCDPEAKPEVKICAGH
jgi:hypothetical protein